MNTNDLDADVAKCIAFLVEHQKEWEPRSKETVDGKDEYIPVSLVAIVNVR